MRAHPNASIRITNGQYRQYTLRFVQLALPLANTCDLHLIPSNTIQPRTGCRLQSLPSLQCAQGLRHYCKRMLVWIKDKHMFLT